MRKEGFKRGCNKTSSIGVLTWETSESNGNKGVKGTLVPEPRVIHIAPVIGPKPISI